MALGGAELLIYPTAIGWDRTDNEDEQQRQLGAWQLVQRGHAVANGLPVLVCNRVGFEASPTEGDPGIEFWGNSFIAGPQGELLAKADIDATVLTAEVSLRRSEDVRRIWPFLRDRRIDSYNEITKRFID
jgi:N-carbamoylputrescine amidase